MAVEKNSAVLTEEGVKVLIVDAIKGLMTREQLAAALAEACKGLITEARAKEIVADAQKVLIDYVSGVVDDAQLQPAGVLSITGEEPKPPLDPAWLKGLVFRGAKGEEREVDGKKKTVSIPFSRPLTRDDVLNYSVGEDTVTIVAGDGQKHTVDI